MRDIVCACEMSFGLLVLLIGVVYLLLSFIGVLGCFDHAYSGIWLACALWFFLYDCFIMVESHIVMRVIDDLWFYSVVLSRFNIHKFS